MYEHGQGVPRDLKTAVRYYTKACKVGNHPKAYIKCGDYFYSKN